MKASTAALLLAAAAVLFNVALVGERMAGVLLLGPRLSCHIPCLVGPIGPGQGVPGNALGRGFHLPRLLHLPTCHVEAANCSQVATNSYCVYCSQNGKRYVCLPAGGTPCTVRGWAVGHRRTFSSTPYPAEP